ncbi:MAG TPA: hypothetical protein VFI34_01405 [Candidatus Limnocylindrales bacterium]|nr:hypothetical protein [Candidatus Limnocylindrales bacterium]
MTVTTERDLAQEARAGGRAMLRFWRQTSGGVMFLPAPGGGDYDRVLARDALWERSDRDRNHAWNATEPYT